MMRKTAISLSVCMCLGVSANAADVKIPDNKNRVEISEAVEKDKSAMLMVVKSGAPLKEESYVTVRVADSIEDGNAVWNFGMPADSDGEYDWYIKQNGIEFKKGTFVYATLENRSEVIENLKNVTSGESLKEILDKEENVYALKVFGFDMDRYADSDKLSVSKKTVESLDNLNDVKPEEASKVFNLTLAAQNISDGGNVKELLLSANPEFDSKMFSEIKDEKLTEWICKIIKNGSYSSGGELSEMYQVANILYIINNSRVNYIAENIEKYADMLGISKDADYKEYKNLKNKESVNKKIVKSLSSNPAEDADDVTDAIGDALEVSDSKPTGGGGGGGGGSKPSGVTVTSPSAVKPVQESEKPAGKTGFTDLVQAEWAREAVEKMTESEIISGDEKGKFRPNDNITREEFVKMLVLATGSYDKDAECDFEDSKPGDWHYKYIASAFKKELTRGISETMFGTGTRLTRQDMALLCRRASGTLENKREKITFSDDGDIADYAKEAVYELYCAEGINGMGDNTFSPLSFATRAQAAMIIYNLFLK